MKSKEAMMEYFKSRKNMVWYDKDRHCVVKTFTSRKAFEKEKEIYDVLEKIMYGKIPKILKIDYFKKQIIFEFVNEQTIVEEIEVFEKKEDVISATEILTNVLEWLDILYEALRQEDNQYIMGDVNLRNFMTYNKKIIGIDFETVQHGSPREEKIELLSRYLIYDPCKTAFKKEVVSQVIKTYNQKNICCHDFQKILDKADAILMRRYKEETPVR